MSLETMTPDPMTDRPGRAPLPIRFADYAAFKTYVRDRYAPLPQEQSSPDEGFAPGTSWALRGAPRFYRALRAIRDHTRAGGTLLDVGAYPGSFARLAREAFGGDLRVVACGMPVSGEFAEALAAEGVPFTSCNIDPDIASPLDLPVGLPYADGSVDVITCMEVVEHLYSLKTLFTEFARVLAPGGVVYLTTNNIADRIGLIRALRDQETNLDRDLDDTTIWSGHDNQWRGHVRFYSTGQLSEAGARAGLTTLHTGGFQMYEDPDVYLRASIGLLGSVRTWLRGRGESPPWYPKLALQALLYLGPRALSHRFDDHVEVTLQRPPL